MCKYLGSAHHHSAVVTISKRNKCLLHTRISFRVVRRSSFHIITRLNKYIRSDLSDCWLLATRSWVFYANIHLYLYNDEFKLMSTTYRSCDGMRSYCRAHTKYATLASCLCTVKKSRFTTLPTLTNRMSHDNIRLAELKIDEPLSRICSIWNYRKL